MRTSKEISDIIIKGVNKCWEAETGEPLGDRRLELPWRTIVGMAHEYTDLTEDELQAFHDKMAGEVIP